MRKITIRNGSQFILFPILAMLALSGCASLNKSECLNANWEQIGFTDGSRGRASSYIGRHRSACAEYGIRPDQAQYSRGYQRGLERYCTPANGYQVGLRGRRVTSLCPDHLHTNFAQANELGYGIYQLQREQANLRKTANKINHDITHVQQQIDVLSRSLLHSQTTGPAQSSQYSRAEQKLKKERREVLGMQVELQRIANARHKGARFKKYLQDKIREKEGQSSRITNRILREYKLSRRDRSLLSKLKSQAQTVGKARDHQLWVQKSSDGNLPHMHNRKVIRGTKNHEQQKLYDIVKRLSQQSAIDRRSIRRLVVLNKQIGALRDHFYIVTHIRRLHSVGKLVNFHVERMLASIDKQIASLRSPSYRYSGGVNDKKYQQLLALEDELHGLQHTLEENLAQQKLLDNEIRERKRHSPYH